MGAKLVPTDEQLLRLLCSPLFGISGVHTKPQWVDLDGLALP